MWVIIIVIFSLALGYFFAWRLQSEFKELGIVDISESMVSLVGIFLYVKEKRKRKEPFSFNFYACVLSALLIFSPFVYIMIK
jgi:hypothetical protein